MTLAERAGQPGRLSDAKPPELAWKGFLIRGMCATAEQNALTVRLTGFDNTLGRGYTNGNRRIACWNCG